MSRASKEILKDLWRQKETASARERQTEEIKKFSPGQFYFGADDNHLKSITGNFPAVICSTHPVYVLEKIANLGYKLCPCTTSKHLQTPTIKKNCILEDTGRRIKRTSYVLTRFTFNITKGENFRSKLDYAGLVPEKCFKESK